MSAAATTEHGLDDETLAAFVDGKLNESERAAVIEHLAACGECRSKANDASEIAGMLAAETNVAEFPARKSRWPWIAALAAAAVIAIVLLGPMRDSIFDDPGIPMLVEASSQLETRRTYGRLSGGFPYKEMMRITRGPGDAGVDSDQMLHDLPLLQAQGKIQNATRPDPHARSVGMLLLGHQAQAVEALEALLATNPPNRDAVAQDLAVALLQRGENERSLQLSNELWAKARTPEIAWNRAYALQHLGRSEAAVAAWDEYLQLDASSPWRQEAIRRRDEAQQDLQLEREIQPGRR